MTDNIQQKIYEVFKNETRLSFQAIDQFLSDNNIQNFDEASIKNAIQKHKEEIDKIDIPRKIDTVKSIIPEIRTKWNGEQTWKYKDINIYENGMPENEVNKLRRKVKPHQININLLELLLRITQRFTPQEMTTSSESIKKISKKEGLLIDLILDIVVMGFIKEDEYKKYSLRTLADEVTKKGYKIDHSTLGNKFNRENFKILITASIRRKKDSLKKPDEKQRLDSFLNWFNIVYWNNTSIFKKSTNQKSIRKNDEITDTATDRKSGKSGLHPGFIQDELEEKWGIDEQQNDDNE